MTDGVNDRMHDSLPPGLVERLSATGEIRSAAVARARRRAVARCFEERPVVEEIATQLLLMSSEA